MDTVSMNGVICFITLASMVFALIIFAAVEPIDKIKALGELFKDFAGLFDSFR